MGRKSAPTPRRMRVRPPVRATEVVLPRLCTRWAPRARPSASRGSDPAAARRCRAVSSPLLLLLLFPCIPCFTTLYDSCPTPCTTHPTPQLYYYTLPGECSAQSVWSSCLLDDLAALPAHCRLLHACIVLVGAQYTRMRACVGGFAPTVIFIRTGLHLLDTAANQLMMLMALQPANGPALDSAGQSTLYVIRCPQHHTSSLIFNTFSNWHESKTTMIANRLHPQPQRCRDYDALVNVEIDCKQSSDLYQGET